MRQLWQKLTTSAIVLGVMGSEPGWSDVSPTVSAPVYSEPFCLKIFEEVVEKARSSSWQISDRDRHILTQCRTKFPPTATTQIPLPTAAECVYVVKTLVQGGLSKVKEIELPEEQLKSIERCDEVIRYYALSADNMLPTLPPRDRIIVDKTSYQTQSPQRGDIIVFYPDRSVPIDSQPPLTQRAIGLPGETVKIDRGKVYIDGKLYPEDYTVGVNTARTESIVVPANSYFVLSDNRRDSPGITIAREAILGKVIWHFGNKK